MRLLTVAALACAGCSGAPVLAGPLPATWGGATVHDLSRRSDADIRELVDVAARANLRVLRTFVLDVEEPLGRWSDGPLERIDVLLAAAARRGVKVIVVLHDGPQRADAYAKAHPGAAFYAEPSARAAFRRRIEHVLNYRGPSTGRAWRELGDALFAWELQGECRWFHAPEWVDDMAFYVKQLAPEHKVACGGLGRVTEGDLARDTVRASASVDLWLYRPSSEPADKAAALLRALGRPWIVADFGGVREDPHAARKSIEAGLKAARECKAPWIFWSLGPDRRIGSHDLWPGDTLFDSFIVPAASAAGR